MKHSEEEDGKLPMQNAFQECEDLNFIRITASVTEIAEKRV